MALNTVPPKPPEEGAATATNTGATPDQNTGQVSQDVTPPVVPPAGEPPKVDEFFETFNKRFSKQYKTDDDIKVLFDSSEKISDYEKQLKELDSVKKNADEYKNKVLELEGLQDPLKYFSSPESYVAEQLRIKYPKSNPEVLQRIAMTNVDKLDDLDVLIKDRQLFVPDAPKEEVIRKIVLKKYGIDPTLPPEEWDEVSLGEMKLDAASAREKINGLKGVIELPKVPTQEQKDKDKADALTVRQKAVTPIKEEFNKFDLFTHEDIEGFSMDVPGDYKNKLSDMFEAMFIKAGLEPTQENKDTALELRNALFVHEYLPKLRDVWIKEGETKNQAKVDAELNNTQPPNTATATDQHDVKPKLPGPGLDQFLRDQKGK